MTALAYPSGARNEADALAFLEDEVLRALVAGDGIRFAPDADLTFKAHGFAFAVLYGVDVIDFTPDTRDEEHAVEAATYIVATWVTRRASH